MTNALKVANFALNEIGFKETNSNNINPYAAYLDTIPGFYNGKKNGFAWCDIFVDYCFVKCFGIENAKRMIFHNDCGAGCIFSARAYRDNGRFDKIPQVGDQIFFGKPGNETHTGIVYEVTPTQVTTVEGNTSDKVARRTYNRTDTSIVGYGHPLFDILPNAEELEIETVPLVEPIPVITSINKYPTLKQGDGPDNGKRIQVAIMQQALKLTVGKTLLGADGIDGEFGPQTRLAVMAFQNKYGLTPDGIFGDECWTIVMGGDI